MSTSFHASLRVQDVDRSVNFYRTLLGVEPSRCEPEYAKFELQDPPIVLSLARAPSARGGALDHLGLRLESPEALELWEERIATITRSRETGVVCCGVRQTKLWVEDPDGNAWEIYVRHDEEELTAKKPPRPQPAPARTLVHHLGEPLTEVSGTLDEVLMEGTFNAKIERGVLRTWLASAFQALVPTGKLTVHGLVAAEPVPAGSLPLPGPAARVERLPMEGEVSTLLAAAGFIDITIEKLPSAANLQVKGVELREIVVTARVPAAGQKDRHEVIYLGPFARVTTDGGFTFERGRREWITRDRVDSIQAGPLAAHFCVVERSLPSPTAETCCT